MVQELNEKDQFVDSAHAVQGAIQVPLPPKKPTGTGEPTIAEIRDVMRQDLGMRYRKVVAVSVHANGAKNLVLRQQYA